MKITLKERFLRSGENLPAGEQAKMFNAIVQLRNALSNPHQHTGLGIRKLKGRHWELRVGLALRALFELEPGQPTFLLLGTHDEVQRFLRNL